ncbi:MAG: hypothetical protein KF723_15440 [Rhizobiaceae bacterium]|nr:hypothetical protein [Rhizobiaceae bacterium]
MSSLQRFLGDSPLRVLIKLLVVSFLVGVVMNTFGWWPADVFRWFADTLRGLWEMGFAAIDRAAAHILVGAAVVIPVFLLIRLLRMRRE